MVFLALCFWPFVPVCLKSMWKTSLAGLRWCFCTNMVKELKQTSKQNQTNLALCAPRPLYKHKAVWLHVKRFYVRLYPNLKCSNGLVLTQLCLLQLSTLYSSTCFNINIIQETWNNTLMLSPVSEHFSSSLALKRCTPMTAHMFKFSY